MRVGILGSGSQGNSIAVQSRRSTVLLDCGFGPRSLKRRARASGIPLDSVAAIVLTHEHGDHARGAQSIAREFGCPIYGSPGTLAALSREDPDIEWLALESHRPVSVASFAVLACRTNHDAAEPLALRICERDSGAVLGLAYDIGRSSAGVRHLLRGCHCIVLEANHDEMMLRTGPYPPSVRQRIAGSGGHLSNRAAAELLAELMHDGLSTVVLAHLSGKCNSPQLARTMVRRELTSRGFKGSILVARQRDPLPVFDLVGSEVQRTLFVGD